LFSHLIKGSHSSEVVGRRVESDMLPGGVWNSKVWRYVKVKLIIWNWSSKSCFVTLRTYCLS